jgi:hypothetical protein
MFMLSFIDPVIELSMFMLSFIDPVIELSMFIHRQFNNRINE